MKLHPLLKRQLKRIELKEDEVPSLEKWNAFLERINRSYEEADQERYLNELSIEVSSRETAELNHKLERAQKLARMGYWHFDRVANRISWSKEMYQLFGDNPTNGVPTYAELMDRFDEADRSKLTELIDRAFEKGEKYEFESKMKKANGNKCWFYFAGNPLKNSDGSPIRYLSGIVIDISRKKDVEKEMQKLNQQLMLSARRAGMAEVATSVLHNIGNILNSVNISTQVIQKNLQNMGIEKLQAAIEMLSTHLSDIKHYLTEDEKGKLIPNYLIEKSKIANQQKTQIFEEIARLYENIAHVKSIVKSQNVLSGSSTFYEEVSLNKTINAAITLSESSFFNREVELEKHYEKIPMIYSDKNKIMQILVNIIQNAKEALEVTTSTQLKKIFIHTKLDQKENTIEIRIRDTGIGISPEISKKLFSFGFTTKPHGHGFGLHSSALLAKELGGSLQAESEGIGFGATFILKLPLITQKTKDVYEQQI